MRPQVRDSLNSAQRAALALMPPYADHCVISHRTPVGCNWLIRRIEDGHVTVESVETPGVFGQFDLRPVDVEAYVSRAVGVSADLYPGS